MTREKMTKDEAIAIIRKEYLCVDRDCDIERNCGKCDLMIPSKEPILEAYKMALKALEQEPILDKIRAEIMRLQTYKMFGGEDTVYVEHEDILAIIDKYKAESEGKA